MLLDPNQWDKEKSLEFTVYSDDGRYLAYGVAGGDENPVVRILDLETALHLPDTLSGWKQRGIWWHPNNAGFFYTAHPLKGTVPEGEEEYFHSTYYHKLGTEGALDKKVFFSSQKEHYHFGFVTEDYQWEIFYRSIGSSENEVYVRPSLSNLEPTPITKGYKGEYSIDIFKNQIYILTDLDTPL